MPYDNLPEVDTAELETLKSEREKLIDQLAKAEAKKDNYKPEVFAKVKGKIESRMVEVESKILEIEKVLEQRRKAEEEAARKKAEEAAKMAARIAAARAKLIAGAKLKRDEAEEKRKIVEELRSRLEPLLVDLDTFKTTLEELDLRKEIDDFETEDEYVNEVTKLKLEHGPIEKDVEKLQLEIEKYEKLIADLENRAAEEEEAATGEIVNIPEETTPGNVYIPAQEDIVYRLENVQAPLEPVVSPDDRTSESPNASDLIQPQEDLNAGWAMEETSEQPPAQSEETELTVEEEIMEPAQESSSEEVQHEKVEEEQYYEQASTQPEFVEAAPIEEAPAHPIAVETAESETSIQESQEAPQPLKEEEKKSGDWDEIEEAFFAANKARPLANPCLVLISGGQNLNVSYNLRSDVTRIGSAEFNDIQLKDATVDKKHAKIWVERGIYMIKDLGSKSGTLINGRRIKKERLNHLDQLTLGKLKFQVRLI